MRPVGLNSYYSDTVFDDDPPLLTRLEVLPPNMRGFLNELSQNVYYSCIYEDWFEIHVNSEDMHIYIEANDPDTVDDRFKYFMKFQHYPFGEWQMYTHVVFFHSDFTLEYESSNHCFIFHIESDENTPNFDEWLERVVEHKEMARVVVNASEMMHMKSIKDVYYYLEDVDYYEERLCFRYPNASYIDRVDTVKYLELENVIGPESFFRRVLSKPGLVAATVYSLPQGFSVPNVDLWLKFPIRTLCSTSFRGAKGVIIPNLGSDIHPKCEFGETGDLDVEINGGVCLAAFYASMNKPFTVAKELGKPPKRASGKIRITIHNTLTYIGSRWIYGMKPFTVRMISDVLQKRGHSEHLTPEIRRLYERNPHPDPRYVTMINPKLFVVDMDTPSNPDIEALVLANSQYRDHGIKLIFRTQSKYDLHCLGYLGITVFRCKDVEDARTLYVLMLFLKKLERIPDAIIRLLLDYLLVPKELEPGNEPITYSEDF